MSSITVYNPTTQTFGTFDPNTITASGTLNLLLFNILIELHVHTAYLEAMNRGIITEMPSQIRAGIVSNT